MVHYIYLCPKCAKEKHKFKVVHFPHGFGVEEEFIDDKKNRACFISAFTKTKMCRLWKMD